MTKITSLPDLMPYDEVYRILKEKFNATPEEVRYWIKRSIETNGEDKKGGQEFHKDDLFMRHDDDGLVPLISDLPLLNMYIVPDEHFFYPECYFFKRKSVLNFVPPPPSRFVYQKDLTGKRNWNDYRGRNKDSSRSITLLKANECGVLRFYDHSIDEFTFFANESQLWCHSFEGEKEYVESPESFFLLYDILNVERIFFGKDKELCLNELGLKPIDLPKNVINLKKE